MAEEASAPGAAGNHAAAATGNHAAAAGQDAADRKPVPVVIGCFDGNGKCNLRSWRKARAGLRARPLEELRRLACKLGVDASDRLEKEALVSVLMETEELAELTFPSPPTWKEFEAACKKSLGRAVTFRFFPGAVPGGGGSAAPAGGGGAPPSPRGTHVRDEASLQACMAWLVQQQRPGEALLRQQMAAAAARAAAAVGAAAAPAAPAGNGGDQGRARDDVGRVMDASAGVVRVWEEGEQAPAKTKTAATRLGEGEEALSHSADAVSAATVLDQQATKDGENAAGSRRDVTVVCVCVCVCVCVRVRVCVCAFLSVCVCISL